MTTAAPSTALATIQPAFTDAERFALAGFLAGYRGLTREAYARLRQFTTWCRARSLNLFAVRRADIEGFARELEARGRARATVTRRLCTIAGFYRYAVEEELLEHSPAAHVRRPRVDYESHAVALDRNELGASTFASSPPGAGPAPFPCSPSAAPTSRSSPVTWRPGAAHAPPLPGGCPPSRGSTSTRSKKNSWTAPQRPMSAGRGSTTSPMPSRWTATSSAPCWSPQD